MRRAMRLLLGVVFVQVVWLFSTDPAAAAVAGGEDEIASCSTCLESWTIFGITHEFREDCCDPSLGAEDCYSANLKHTQASGGSCANHHGACGGDV